MPWECNERSQWKWVIHIIAQSMLAINIIITLLILTLDFQRLLWSRKVRNSSPYCRENKAECLTGREVCQKSESVRDGSTEVLALDLDLERTPSFDPLAWACLAYCPFHIHGLLWRRFWRCSFWLQPPSQLAPCCAFGQKRITHSSYAPSSNLRGQPRILNLAPFELINIADPWTIQGARVRWWPTQSKLHVGLLTPHTTQPLIASRWLEALLTIWGVD